MPQPNGTTVDSIQGYVEAIDSQLELARTRNAGVLIQQNWYRGISKVSHKLSPSLFRVKRTPLEHLNVEYEMMQEFERHAILRKGTPEGDKDRREEMLKLFEMQHYGIPTRLLDWSTNPFVGLYFALSTDVSSKENPAVWVCDPWAWNRVILDARSWEGGGPAHISEYAVSQYHPVGTRYDSKDLSKVDPYPVAILGVYNSERMRAQRGVFTLFGKKTEPMEKVYELHPDLADSLFRIEIDRAKALDIFNKLVQMGFTDSVAYPDFQGVALEIRRRFGHLT